MHILYGLISIYTVLKSPVHCFRLLGGKGQTKAVFYTSFFLGSYGSFLWRKESVKNCFVTFVTYLDEEIQQLIVALTITFVLHNINTHTRKKNRRIKTILEGDSLIHIIKWALNKISSFWLLNRLGSLVVRASSS